MHPYHVDEKLKIRIIIVAGFLSVFANWILHYALILFKIDLQWWIETPSILGFLGFFIWFYDNYLWNKWPLRILSFFYIPDLRGTWKVEICSSYKGFEEKIHAEAYIRQTASKICISIKTQNSLSYSLFAALLRTNKFDAFELIYYYINRPKASSIGTMNIHYGTTWLELSEDKSKLEGEYFSGRGRQNFGSILFKKNDESSKKRK